MSQLRPTLHDTNAPGLSYRSTYFRVLEATAHRRELLHGKLNDNQGHACALGCYFDEASMPIDSQAIDEIATYNDSFPKLTMHERWKKVRKWLRFQVKQFETGKKEHKS